MSTPEEGILELLNLVPHVDDRTRRETPRRVVKAFQEMTRGYDVSPESVLAFTEKDRAQGLVVLRGIEFTSLCAHHLLPFSGQAVIGYVPNGLVVGLSKLARLVVDCRAPRLQLQERLCRELAEDLEEYINPAGVGVMITAKHACMACRGVVQPQAEMVSTSWRGVLCAPELRSEFLALAHN